MNQVLNKRPNESVDDYIYRICALRENLNLTWYEIRDVINDNLGWNLHEDSYRKRFKNLQRMPLIYNESEQLCMDMFEEDNCNDYENQLNELKKERYKLADERIQNNAIIRRIAREETLKEIAHDFAKTMNSKVMLESHKSNNLETNKEKDGSLLISDWHYGIEIDNYFNKYDTAIAKSRIQQLQDEVIKYIKKEKLTHLNVLNLGDLVAGRIHLQLRLNSRIDVITQIMEVSELLAEFLCNISAYVDSIDYYSTLDNHSRLEPNIKDAMDLESLVRITDWYLEERLKYRNININRNEFADDIILFDVFNFKIAGVHGHKDKPNKIIDGLSMFSQQHLDLICAAHYHHFSSEEKNETLLISNSSLMGTDDYAENLRLNAKPSQVLIISTPENVCECLYKINLN